MRRLLAAGAHSILDLFPLVRVARVPFADTAPFFNVNTPADWAEAQRRLGVAAETRRPGRAATAAARRRDARDPRRRRPAEQRQDDAHRAAHPGVHAPRPPRRRRQARGTLRHRRAGQGLVAPWSGRRRCLHRGVARPSSPSSRAARTRPRLEEIVGRYFGGYDVVVCEGYRREAPDVVEVFRSGAGYESPVCEPAEALALVTDTELAHAHRFGLERGRGARTVPGRAPRPGRPRVTRGGAAALRVGLHVLLEHDEARHRHVARGPLDRLVQFQPLGVPARLLRGRRTRGRRDRCSARRATRKTRAPFDPPRRRRSWSSRKTSLNVS